MGNAVSRKLEETSASGQKEAHEDKKKSPIKRPEGDKPKRGSMQENSGQRSGGGWFGGIFSKLSMKPKNQMILPDDKNPTVSNH